MQCVLERDGFEEFGILPQMFSNVINLTILTKTTAIILFLCYHFSISHPESHCLTNAIIYNIRFYNNLKSNCLLFYNVGDTVNHMFFLGP